MSQLTRQMSPTDELPDVKGIKVEASSPPTLPQALPICSAAALSTPVSFPLDLSNNVANMP